MEVRQQEWLSRYLEDLSESLRLTQGYWGRRSIVNVPYTLGAFVAGIVVTIILLWALGVVPQ